LHHLFGQETFTKTLLSKNRSNVITGEIVCV
jgi:hypothetical protein